MSDAAPAPSPEESTASISSARDQTPERPKKARRTFLTQNACFRCRAKKSKCDGVRPGCGRCEKNGAECMYDVAQEGITRMQNLQQRLGKSNEDFERLMILCNALKSGTDQDATSLLARLRLGESIASLIQHLKDPNKLSSRRPEDPRDTQDVQMMDGVYSWPTSPYEQAPSDCSLTPGQQLPSELETQPEFTRPGDSLSEHRFEQQRPPQYQTPHTSYAQDHGPYYNQASWQGPYAQDGEHLSNTSRLTSMSQHHHLRQGLRAGVSSLWYGEDGAPVDGYRQSPQQLRYSIDGGSDAARGPSGMDEEEEDEDAPYIDGH